MEDRLAAAPSPSLGVLVLCAMLCCAVGCGEDEDGEHGVLGDQVRCYDLLLKLQFTEGSVADRVHSAKLRVSDPECSQLVLDPMTTTVEGDSVSFQGLVLAEGEYNFTVDLFDENGYVVGTGGTTVTLTQSTTVSLVIEIVAYWDFRVEVDVSWEEGDSCQTITSPFLGGVVYVYGDDDTRTLNRFYPCGWMGDIQNITYADTISTNPHSGETCIRITYSGEDSVGWAGIYWLPVPTVRDDWGNVVFGVDLRGALSLTWCARGEEGGEKIEFFAGGVSDVRCPDTLPKKTSSPVVVTLDTTWVEYEIDLSAVPSTQLSHVVGGFGWATNKIRNPDGCTFYVDRVRFEQ